MKKILLIAAAFGLSLFNASAQRVSLYEQFSGENCNPCAVSNPGFWSLLTSGTNSSKIILVKYQVNIPVVASGGTLINQSIPFAPARRTYYGVNGAPIGRINGTGLGTGTAAPTSPGHIANLTQGDIDGAASQTSPFTITVTGSWNGTGTQVNTNINVTANINYTPANANLKLRVALVETVDFDVAPGTNGEKIFHNVARMMLPDANGTALNSTWSATESQQFTLSAAVPYYIDKTHGLKIVAWVQNDLDKSIVQAAISSELPKSLAVDIATEGLPSTTNKLICVGSPFTPTIKISNKGTGALTTATVFYRFGSGSWLSKVWNGNLAAGASANFTLDAITLSTSPSSGEVTFSDSIALATDLNNGNNTSSRQFTAATSTPATVPSLVNFETTGGFPAGWIAYDSDKSGNTWVNGQSDNGLAFERSNDMAWFKGFEYPKGTSSILLFPPPSKINGSSSMNFRVANALKTPEAKDKLEVVSSTDCGSTWTTLWSKSGLELMTAAQFQPNERWIPRPDNSQGAWEWRLESVDLSNLPNNAILGFRATSDNGNSLFIDNVELLGKPASLKEEIKYNSIALAPNPASNSTTLGFELLSPATVNIQVYDISGRLVISEENKSFGAGKNEFELNTTALNTGLYSVKITSANETMTQKLMIAK